MSEILSGIYKIYCKDTNKYYIGQSVNVKKRLRTHLNELRNNNHINQSLQRDFNTCGEGAFIFEKIKDVEEEFLNIFEKYYMEYHNTLKNGYNVIPMNDLIKDKYKDKGGVEALKNINPIEVPLVAGDIYAYELLSDIELIEDELIGRDTTLVDDYLKSTVKNIGSYLSKRDSDFWRKTTEIIELELRRKFNKIGINDVEIGEIKDYYKFLDTKILPVNVWVDGEFVELNVKCTK